MKRVTIRDVAALAGVSSTTVSRTLNDSPAISEATKEKVRAACEALNYVPDIAARGLSSHTTNMIGVIVPDVSNPYFSALFASIEECAAENSYQVLLTNTLHDPALEMEAIDWMLSQQVDGMIISAYSPQSQERDTDLLGDLPCVYLDSNHGPSCSYVEVDNDLGAFEASQYLCRLGHRQIVFLGGRTGSRTLEQRLAGYRRSMLMNGLTPYEFVAPESVQKLRSWCYERAEELFRGGCIPDAVIAYSDAIAMQVLAAAEKHGLRAPEDFSIVGFDDISISMLPQIHLTSISQQKSRTGRMAVERLVAQIKDGIGQTADIVQPELMIRSSCRKK